MIRIVQSATSRQHLSDERTTAGEPVMQHTIATAFGPALAAPPESFHFPTSPAALRAAAERADALAERLLQAGLFGAADSLTHAAIEMKCRATRCRA
jgi:hypothetical protein